MIGQRFKEKSSGREFEVSTSEAGAWLVRPLEHGPVERVSTAELASRFRGVKDPAEPKPASEEKGWESLSRRFVKAINERKRVRLPSPEEVFSGEADGEAPNRAEAIFADPIALTDFELGYTRYDPATEAQLDKLIAARNRREPE